MYKDDIRKALMRVELIPGGAVQGLLAQIQAAGSMLNVALEEMAANNDSSIRAGCSHLQEAVRPIAKQLQDVSPSGTAVELHELAKRFDLTIEQYPLLEELLRPGRQALGTLAGAFDVVLQKNKSVPSITGLVAPGSALVTCYAHYEALSNLFVGTVKEEFDQSSVILELDGVNRLRDFAGYIDLLSRLADLSKWTMDQADQQFGGSHSEILIASIESGSPVRINIIGDSKALRLLLAMVRDAVRIPYLHLTRHGRTIQAMETLARAKELGITSDVVLDKLNDAMVVAADNYAKSFRHEDVAVTIDGQSVRAVSSGYPTTQVARSLDKPTQPKLQGPGNTRAED